MARYLRETKGENDKSEEAIAARADLFVQMQKAAGEAYQVYEKAFERRQEALAKAGAPRTFETVSPMVVGLGGSNVLETGLTLNTLYGAPMIPGSSIKGVVAHYCSKILGATDPAYLGPNLDDRNTPRQEAGKIYEALFGKVDRIYNADGTVSPVPPEEMSGGYLRFYDAWIEPGSFKDAFVNDVMTPHHGDYYGGKAGHDLPTDFDDPNPVTFMTIQGRFEVRVGCETGDLPEEERRQWLDFALELTEKALTAWGIGGKIRAGYGRMQAVASEEEKKAKADQAKAQKLKEAGWEYAEGTILTVKCDSVKEVKGKLKRKFVIDGEAAGQIKEIRFETVPEVEKGQTFSARVKRHDKANKAYIMEKLD